MKFLVVRRDNIGDLVLTTPVFAALKAHFPGARVEALANTYNAPILEGHPDLDAVHAYKKDKHLDPGESRLANWTARLAQYMRLRRSRFDTVIVASPGWRARACADAPSKCRTEIAPASHSRRTARFCHRVLR